MLLQNDLEALKTRFSVWLCESWFMKWIGPAIKYTYFFLFSFLFIVGWWWEWCILRVTCNWEAHASLYLIYKELLAPLILQCVLIVWSSSSSQLRKVLSPRFVIHRSSPVSVPFILWTQNWCDGHHCWSFGVLIKVLMNLVINLCSSWCFQWPSQV